ncbi:MAG: hypothetical protein CL917_17685 [Deltaproteobacteria bacterium]|nr:hypothetical protein [Deltaproteobacteria bacterium]
MSAVANTTKGKIEGKKLLHQFAFKGIPYATAPVGPLRWHPPVPHEAWSDVRPALEYGSSSMQFSFENMLPGYTQDSTSEDCLFLNVWTPKLDGARRPVMVWIHGGGFMYGSGKDLMPAEQSLVNRGDIVLVSMNYRLGSLGFLRLDQATGGEIPACGNEGLLDQIAALQWVQDNIENFGGDPNNVTIFGESAGGMAVGALLGMPEAKGLFHRAIAQSGSAHTANTNEQSLTIAEKVLEHAETRDPKALMALTSQECLDLEFKLMGGIPMSDASAFEHDPEIGTMPFQPCIDGTVLPELPIRSVSKGSATGISVLVGSTLDENKAFVYAEPSIAEATDESIRTLCAHILDIDGLITGYRTYLSKREAYQAPADIFAQIGTDRQFRIPGIRLAETQLAYSPNVYNYIITWPSPAMDGTMGATHGIELGPLFGSAEDTQESADFFGSGPEMKLFSESIQDIWAAFARTGDPSCDAIGDCPAYSQENRATLILGQRCVIENAPFDEERALWDQHSDEDMGDA